MKSSKGPDLWNKAKKLIPGGNQLLSKRSEQFLPDFWPSYYKRAKGVEVWDLDNNHYIDMSIMGIGSCPLGYADDDVNNMVKARIDAGSMCTLNNPEEVELAEVLLKIHPWAEMVRYARCGGEAMAIAVRIARACTGRDKIAFCGYHGWHDWYLAANLADDKSLDGHLLPGLSPNGVPRGLIETSLPFQYNSIKDLRDIRKKHGKNLAAIVMEPVRNQEPLPEFLTEIQDIVEDTGAILIIDEVSSGFRLNTGGAHLLYNIKPDIAVFAKAMSNGFPMAAIIGKEYCMQAAQDTFISSTYWSEGIGPVAALATIEKFQRYNVPNHLIKMGTNIQKGWKKAADESDVEISVNGIHPLSQFSFIREENKIMHTLFTQLMLEHEFIAGKSFYPCYVHSEKCISDYMQVVGDIFNIINRGISKGNIREMIRGPVAKTGFYRLT